MTRRRPELTVRWSRRENALLYTCTPSTGGFVAYCFEQLPTHMGPPLLKELEARGYDLTTLRFTIQKKVTP